MRGLAIAVIMATAVLLGSAGVFGQGVLSDGMRLEGPGGNVLAWLPQSEGEVEKQALRLVYFLEDAKRKGLRWYEIEPDVEELYERARVQQGRGDMGFSVEKPPYGSRAERELSGRLIAILYRVVRWAIEEGILWPDFRKFLRDHYEQELCTGHCPDVP